MKKAYFLIIIVTILGSCGSSRMGKVRLGEDGKIISGTTTQRCTPPTKRYSNNLAAKVKIQVDSLIKIPIHNIEAELDRTVVKLSDYTSEGLDLDLFLFRVCEMANNRGMTSAETQQLIYRAMESWNSSQEVKKKSTTLNVRS